MAFPDPEPGLVIRYDYLWTHEAAAGRIRCQRRRENASARRSKDASMRLAGRPPAGGLPAFRDQAWWRRPADCRGGVARTPLALFEPVAVAVHFEDVDVVGQPVEQRAGQRSEPNTPVHSSNGRLLVTMVEPRS